MQTQPRPSQRVAKQDMLDRVREIAPMIASRALKTGQQRVIPKDIIVKLKELQVFDVLIPRGAGGLELEVSAFSSISRELGYACGSTAWVFAVLAESGWIAASFPAEAQEQLWAKGERPLICASILPTGKAIRVDGGYLVSGTWQYLSGSDFADWVILSVNADDDDGMSTVIDVLVPKGEVRFLDDWHVTGMSATGSNGCVADQLFVPDCRTIFHSSLFDGSSPGGKLHPNFKLGSAPRNFITSFALSPVIVGLASRALDIVKKNLSDGAGSPATAEWAATQSRFADAFMEVETANSILTRYQQQIDQALEAGLTVTTADATHNRIAASYMVRQAKQAIDRLVGISGSRWVRDSDLLQLIWRDASVIATHRSMSWDINSIPFCNAHGVSRTVQTSLQLSPVFNAPR